MEYFATTIVIFAIFAAIIWFATLVFIAIDKDAKEDGYQRRLWFLGGLLIGPLILIPYWFLGRNRPV